MEALVFGGELDGGMKALFDCRGLLGLPLSLKSRDKVGDEVIRDFWGADHLGLNVEFGVAAVAQHGGKAWRTAIISLRTSAF